MCKQIEIDFREWKQVPAYEGLYDLRDDGLLYSYPRPHCCGGYTYGNDIGDGYFKVVLTKNSKKTHKTVHRLVWEVFVGPIPEGYDIHHKNHIRNDNRLENLCLIENRLHYKLHSKENFQKLKENLDRSIPVVQYTKDEQFVAEYTSISEAKRQTGIPISSISNCCNGVIKNGYKVKSAGGFIWKFK